MSKLDDILKYLAQDNGNLDLNYAISSWCHVVSQLGHYDPLSIENYAQKWLNDNYIISSSFEFYQQVLFATNSNKLILFWNFNPPNEVKKLVYSFFLDNISEEDFKTYLKESKNKVSIEIVLLIAFVLTGVGLLLFLLNRQENTSRSRKNQNSSSLPRQSYVPEKYILALLVNGDRNQQLINSLKNSRTVTQEDSSQLYDATQALWIGTKSKFDDSLIKSEFNNYKGDIANSEYDVYFVTIELNKTDSGFTQDANQMDRIDAFNELANNAKRITVSERLLSKAYENTEFYSR